MYFNSYSDPKILFIMVPLCCLYSGESFEGKKRKKPHVLTHLTTPSFVVGDEFLSCPVLQLLPRLPHRRHILIISVWLIAQVYY